MLKRPLLAAKTTDKDLRRLKWPMLLSPKIDGIRALVVNGQLVSRTMKPIRNIYTQELFGRPELDGLDGELVVGEPWDKDLMQKTSSGVMSAHGKPAVRFFVFDKWNDNGWFKGRLDTCMNITLSLDPSERVSTLSHHPVFSYEDMIIWEHRYLKKGYEGVMLRSIDGPYKQNRSTLREAILLKVKRFHDAEAIILDSSPLLRNLNAAQLDERGFTKRSTHGSNKVEDDLLGSLLVRDISTGISFDIGSGFTEIQRRELWENPDSLKGRIIKYKCFNVTGVKDKPRFPIFLGFRDPEDM